MIIYLSTVNGYDGKSIIGVFSTKEKALSESISYLLKSSISMENDEILTPINERVEIDVSYYDITNSADILVIRQMKIDEVKN